MKTRAMASEIPSRQHDPFDDPADVAFGLGASSTRRRRSRLGLDEPQTAMQKLLLSMASLGVLALVLPGLAAGLVHVAQWPQPWRFITYFVAEVVFIFLLLVVIYLWWKPPWFKEVYLAVESKMICIVYSIPFWFVLGVIVASLLR